MLAHLALESGETEEARHRLSESLALNGQTMDYLPDLANDLELAARLCAVRGQLGRSVELYAGARVLRESVGYCAHEIWWQAWWPDPAPAVTVLRSTVAEPEFERAWARGRAMAVREAFESALEATRDAVPGHAPHPA